jgi:hypothetical protein
MAKSILERFTEIIGNDHIFNTHDYNKALNKIGKKPRAYTVSYEFTQKLCASFDNQTKTMLIIILEEEYGFSFVLWCKIFCMKYPTFKENKKSIEDSGLFENYYLLYKDMAYILYDTILIR